MDISLNKVLKTTYLSSETKHFYRKKKLVHTRLL